MRRFISLFLSGFCATLLFSCSSDIKVELQEPLRGDILNASFVGGFSTKTEVGDITTTHSYATVLWSAQDEMSLLYDDSTSGDLVNAHLVTQQEGTNAQFYPDPALEFNGNSFIGLYPYDATATASVADGTVASSIPATQYGYPGTFDPAAQLAVGVAQSLGSGALNMNFYNVCSGICFTLTKSSYTRIVFSGRSQEKLAGAVVVSLANPEAPQAIASQSSVGSITLLPGGDAATFQKDKDYYISFIPGDFVNGFTMTFYEGSTSVTRTCEASVKFRRGRFGWVKDVDSADRLSNIRDGELLTKNGKPANCYIISAPGTYKFPLVKGNDPDATLDAATSAEVLWETENLGPAPAKGSVVNNVSSNGGFVFFDVPSPMKDGNALIAAKDVNGNILWSWHIWLCAGYDPDASAQTLAGKDKAMMDRNLGALSNSYNASHALSNGFFYQWGRKDPFPGSLQNYIASTTGGTFFTVMGTQTSFVESTSTTGTLSYAIAHPTEFLCPVAPKTNWLYRVNSTLWGAEKTIYDPCPAGWKVPKTYVVDSNYQNVEAEEAWSGVTYERVSNASDGYGAYFNLQGSSQRAWYPCNGYMDGNGVLRMVGQFAGYWSCSPNDDLTYIMVFSQNSGMLTLYPHQHGHERAPGHSVRCIQDL